MIDSDSIVASCDCLVKSPNYLTHHLGCKYRLICERDEARKERDDAREMLKESCKMLKDACLLIANDVDVNYPHMPWEPSENEY